MHIMLKQKKIEDKIPDITNLAATTGATTLQIKYLMLIIIKKKHKKTGYNT